MRDVSDQIKSHHIIRRICCNIEMYRTNMCKMFETPLHFKDETANLAWDAA